MIDKQHVEEVPPDDTERFLRVQPLRPLLTRRMDLSWVANNTVKLLAAATQLHNSPKTSNAGGAKRVGSAIYLSRLAAS